MLLPLPVKISPPYERDAETRQHPRDGPPAAVVAAAFRLKQPEEVEVIGRYLAPAIGGYGAGHCSGAGAALSIKT
jgi:hypothetical protein